MVGLKEKTTINREIALLSHMFTWGNKIKLVTHHPVRGVGYLKAHHWERYLSHEEIQQLLNACTGDMQEMVMLALGTGMWASEVLSLVLSQLENEGLSLRATRSNLWGGG